MPAYERTVEIAATPETIWETWMDVERWPEWAGSIQKAELIDIGHLGAGSRVRIHARGTPTSVWEVTDLRPHTFFAWETKARGVAVVADHQILSRDGISFITLTLRFSGLMATIFRPMIGRTARRNLAMEAEGLKLHCEEKAEKPV